MSLWDEIQKGNVISYKRDEFSLELMKKAFNDMFNKERIKPRTFSIYVNSETSEVLTDEMEYERNPTPELKAKMDARAAKWKEESERSEKIAREKFVQIYGQEMLEFFSLLGKEKDFRYCRDGRWSFFWYIPTDDEYVSYSVVFTDGVFSLEADAGMGFGDTLEKDITKERVLELIKNGYNGD